VSEKDIPTSGSRWEPAGNDAGRTPAPPEGTPVTPAEQWPVTPAEHPTPAEPANRPGRRPGRVALAAMGAGLVLAGGFGGFALVSAATGDGTGTEVSDRGAGTDGDGVPDGPPPGRTTTPIPRERHDRAAPNRRSGAQRPAGAPAPRGRRRPHRRRGAVLGIAAAGQLLVGERGRHPGPDGVGHRLTSAGRLTGLLASDLLLVQVLLMARVPVLERAFGQDRLARHHRIVGFTSFNLLLGHLVLITWGGTSTRRPEPAAAAAVPVRVVHRTWSLRSVPP
jgi:hypothetical protein